MFDEKVLEKLDEGLIYSNVDVDPDVAYTFYVGDHKYIDTTRFIVPELSKEYGKPVEVINVLPNLPPDYMTGNFIVLNPSLLSSSRSLGQPVESFFLPSDQMDIDQYFSESSFVDGVVKKILLNQDSLYLNTFKNTSSMALDRQFEGVKVIGPKSDLFEYFDNKIVQRELMGSLDIPVPAGQIVKSYDDLINAYNEGYASGGKAFVNRARGYGGNGSLLVSSLDDILVSEKLKGHDDFILMEQLDLVRSPSAIGLVANPEEVMFVSVTDQILNGAINYHGSVYVPGSNPFFDEIKESTVKIGKALAEKGYRGFFGVDYIIDGRERLFFGEINPRKVGHYPEAAFAYNVTNPFLKSLPELEFLAVTKGTFDEDLSRYEMPEFSWGVKVIKAKEGQSTLNYIPRVTMEKDVFENGGYTFLDHPGAGKYFLGDGKLARVVYVDQGKASQEKILGQLNYLADRVQYK